MKWQTEANVPTPDARARIWDKLAGAKAWRSKDGRLAPLWESWVELIAAEVPVEQGFPIQRGRQVMFEICQEPLIMTADGLISLVEEMALRAIVRACREYGYLPLHALPVARQETLKKLRRVLPEDASYAEHAYDPTHPHARTIRTWTMSNLDRRVIEQLEGRRISGPVKVMSPDDLDVALHPTHGKGPVILSAQATRPIAAPDQEMRRLMIEIAVLEHAFWKGAKDNVPGSKLFNARRMASFLTHWDALELIIKRDHRVLKLADYQRGDATPREAAKSDLPLAILSRNLPDLNWHQIANLVNRGNGKQVRDVLTRAVIEIALASNSYRVLAHDIAELRDELAELLLRRAKVALEEIFDRERQRFNGEARQLLERFKERLELMRQLFLFVDPADIGFHPIR